MNHAATNLPRKSMSNATWRKSSRSGSGGGGSGSGCVEITTSKGRIGVRDSRNPTGEILFFLPLAQWAHLIREIKDSKLDLQ